VSALSGVRVLYLAALGPAPLAAMLLADLGADVIRVDRVQDGPDITGMSLQDDPRTRGQRGIGIDLKQSDGVELARTLADGSDVFIEGMRPGVAERLGLGPAELCGRNDQLIYGRMTGWGQTGPRATDAGHDINYLAVAGALHPIGLADLPPVPPLNLVADFGGGGAYLAIGLLAALFQRTVSGRGQVVDCAMVDGVASLTAMFHGLLATGHWTDRRQANLLDGAAPYYRAYRTADDKFIAVGALEPKFYSELMHGLGLDPAQWPQHDRTRWASQAAEMAAIFSRHSRDHWARLFSAREACVTPVLTLTEAAAARELRASGTFVEWDGIAQPAPAPKLSDSQIRPRARSGSCSHTDEILGELGYKRTVIEGLRAAKTIA
jgi:alpha-methylacyl-CoA racemase